MISQLQIDANVVFSLRLIYICSCLQSRVEAEKVTPTEKLNDNGSKCDVQETSTGSVEDISKLLLYPFRHVPTSSKLISYNDLMLLF